MSSKPVIEIQRVNFLLTELNSNKIDSAFRSLSGRSRIYGEDNEIRLIYLPKMEAPTVYSSIHSLSFNEIYARKTDIGPNIRR